MRRKIFQQFQYSNFPILRKFSSYKVDIVYENIDVSKYGNLLIENEKKIRNILNQYDYLKYTNGHVPSTLTESNMQDLISMNDEKHRENYIRYLFKTEVSRLKDKLKKREKNMAYERFLQERQPHALGVFDENGQLSYRLWGNTLVSRIKSNNISHSRTERKLRFASLFGQKLVIDLDYDQHMSLNECRIQSRHLFQTLVNNIHSQEPFDIYFTNCQWSNETLKSLKKYFQSSPLSMMSLKQHFQTESYLNLFPKNQLVYLSPDAKEPLLHYNHDDIYIIGAYLDKRNLRNNVSNVKAKQDRLRQYRLPLDEHLQWSSGPSKHLCVPHVVSILNKVKLTENWSTSLQECVPKRMQKNALISLKDEEMARKAYINRKRSLKKFYGE